jgi:FKBP-type peptidyl-prolyl cis-trans isomerase
MLFSCSIGETDYERQVKIDDQILYKYMADNNIQAQKHSEGFYYQVITANPTGAALKKNDVVSFYYSISKMGQLLNLAAEDTKPQNSSMIAPKVSPFIAQNPIETNELPGKKPAQFKLLTYSIIPEGLDYAVSMMRVGEKYRFYIPSYLAYGSYNTSDFSANSNFIIDIRIVSAKTETEIDDIQRDSIENYVSTKYATFEKYASGLYFVDSIPGTGRRPNTVDYVSIDFSRKYMDDNIIKVTNGVSFFLGQGQAVQGLEEGIKLMKEGGTSVLIMPSKLAFKQSLCVIPQKTRANLLNDRIISADVLPYSIVKYVVKLKSSN